MWAAIARIVVGPFFDSLVKWRKAELEAKGSHEKIEENLAIESLRADQAEARLNNEQKARILGKWYAPENLFVYLIALPYYFVAITMDYLVFPALNISHITLPLRGETAAAMSMIMVFWLGKRTVNTVAQIIADALGKR